MSKPALGVAHELPRCACDEGCVCDPRITRAVSLARKSFDKARSDGERDEFRNEAWKILERIYNS